MLGVKYCAIWEPAAEDQSLRLRAGAGWNAGEVGQATLEGGVSSYAACILADVRPVIIPLAKEPVSGASLSCNRRMASPAG